MKLIREEFVQGLIDYLGKMPAREVMDAIITLKNLPVYQEPKEGEKND